MGWVLCAFLAGACGSDSQPNLVLDAAADGPRDLVLASDASDAAGTEVTSDVDATGPDAAGVTGARVVIETSGAAGELHALGQLLFYADAIEVRAIVVPGPTARTRVESLLAAYGEAWPALQRHGRYPEPAGLRAKIVMAGDEASGQAAAATLSSATGDGQPLHWLGFASGTPALRRALDHLRETGTPASTRVRNAQLRVHAFDVGETLEPHTAELGQVLDFGSLAAADQRAAAVFGPVARDATNAGPLGRHLVALAETNDLAGAGAAWLTVLPLLPGSPTVPSEPGWGSWGGRFVPLRDNLPNVFVPAPSDVWMTLTGPSASVARFALAAMADLRAHLSRETSSTANVPPVPNAIVTDAAGRVLAPLGAGPLETNEGATLLFDVGAGAVLTLDASASVDPDGTVAALTWSHHREASRFPGDVVLVPASPTRARLELPVRLAEQQTVHVFCEVSDSGLPTLIRHRRLVFRRSR
ncbi:MAG TPA: hypothetical protein VGF45_03240 [Polyangia bacterium]